MKYLEAKALEKKARKGPPENKAQAPAPQSSDPDATEAAVKLASELGVDLSAVKGTGADGRIIVPDVQAAAGQQPGD